MNSARRGRPPIKLSDEQKQLALRMAADGKSLKDIRNALGLTHSSIWEIQEPEFLENLARTRSEALEDLADSLLTVADSYEDVQRARIHSENVRWILSKRKPETYGDRLDLNVNQTIDLGGALREARARALPQSIPNTNAISETVEISGRPVLDTADQSSAAQSETDPDEKSLPDIFS